MPAQSDGPFSGGRQASRSSDNSLLCQFSCFQMKRKGKDLYHHVYKKAAALWGALMRVNFVFSIVAMMVMVPAGCVFVVAALLLPSYGNACVA